MESPDRLADPGFPVPGRGGFAVGIRERARNSPRVSRPSGSPAGGRSATHVSVPMIRSVLSFALPALVLAPGFCRASEKPPASATPAPADGGVTLPDGATLRTVADRERLGVSSPTALAFDGQGRIFITETHRFGRGVEDNRSHTEWFLDDLASQSTADRRALHEKWKQRLPIEKVTEHSELLRVLEDTDGDGQVDASTVFADGFNDVLDGTMAGVMPYEGTVFLACIPKLLALRDTDGDGKADERTTILDGFGVKVSLRGHDLNGFALGPDGRIYGTLGDRGMSATTREGKRIHLPSQGVAFRFEADGSGFEVIHTGLRNPKEIAFDDFGYAFTVDNNSDQGDAARVVYLVEGGDSGWEMEHQAMHSFHRQIGLRNRPPNRWMDERMWELENDEQPAHILPPIAHLTSGPSGLTRHPGVGFLEAEAGRFIVCDYRGGASNSGLWSFATEPDGAGMKISAPRQIVTGIAVSDVEFSWDGRLFATDFGGGWVSHHGGRLLEIDAGAKKWRADEAAHSAAIMKEGFGGRGSAELLVLLRHHDARIRLRAHIELTRRQDALERLTEATRSTDQMVRVHGVQGLGILARCGPAPSPAQEFREIPSAKLREDAEKALLALTADADEEIRCQALRALIDATTGPGRLQIGPLLADRSPRVRFFAALLVGKRGIVELFGPVCDMLRKNNNRDPYLRHAGAYALQHIAPTPDFLRSLAADESAAVRLAAVVALRRMQAPSVNMFIRDRDPRVADEAIRAICDLPLDNARRALALLMDQLAVREWRPMILRRLLHNSFALGGEENARRILAVAADPEHPADVRVEALRLIAEWTEPFPVDQFTGRWRPIEKREAPWMAERIAEKLPDLLQQDGPVLAAALEAADRHDVSADHIGDDRLREFVRDDKRSAAVRAKALEILADRDPQDLPALLDTLTRGTPAAVAAAALETLVRISPDTAFEPLAAAIDPERPQLTQQVWPLLGRLPGDEVDKLFAEHLGKIAETKGVSPWAIELLETARHRRSPDVRSALRAYRESLETTDDPLAEWNVSLEGGDPEAGQAIFTTHPAGECMRCHKIGGGHDLGGITAPDLAGVASRNPDRRFLLESMLRPNAEIAPGFGALALQFHNGASLGGNFIAATDEHIDIEADGKRLRVRRADIASHSEPVSAMPAMDQVLTPAEARDLVAYLATLTQDVPAATGPEPEILDPASLLVSETTAPETSGDDAIDPAVMKLGKVQYIVCAACHGQNGEGTAAGPPLAASEWVTGPAENLIRIQFRGLRGPIDVAGKTYDFPAGMAPLSYQNDDQVAAVLTYIRNSFGNAAPPVAASEVAALRSEVGKPQLTAADLIPPVDTPTPPPAGTPATEPPAAAAPGKYDDLRTGPAVPAWLVILGGALAVAVITVLQVRRPKSGS